MINSGAPSPYRQSNSKLTKRYYIVKDFDNQDGGFYPFKVTRLSPKLIVGPPIIKLRPTPGIYGSPLTKATIWINSDRYSFKMVVPLNMLRRVVDNIYKYVRKYDPDSTMVRPKKKKDCEKDLVKFTIRTPSFTTNIWTNYQTMLRVIKMIKFKYGGKDRGIRFYSPDGDKVLLNTVLNRLKDLLSQNGRDKRGKDCDDGDKNTIYI